LNGAFLAGHLGEVAELVHEKAEVASYLAPDVLSGRAAIIEPLRRARENGMYEIRLDTVTDLSTTAATGTGSVRHEEANHVIATTRAAWLWSFEGGLLLRSMHYPSESEARLPYERSEDEVDLR
jgi:hypothetical protein